MGNCPYVNQAKSGPSKGWYCNQEGMYVDSSYWKNYCSGSTSYRHCPYLDGDDSFRNSGSSGGSSDGGQTKKKMDIPEAAILLSRNMEGLLRKAIMIPGTPADTQAAAIREKALEAAPVPEED